MRSFYTLHQREKRQELVWTEPGEERSPPPITEIARQAGGYISLYRENLDSLMWLLDNTTAIKHRGNSPSTSCQGAGS